jgi:hypothetical protein
MSVKNPTAILPFSKFPAYFPLRYQCLSHRTFTSSHFHNFTVPTNTSTCFFPRPLRYFSLLPASPSLCLALLLRVSNDSPCSLLRSLVTHSHLHQYQLQPDSKLRSRVVFCPPPLFKRLPRPVYPPWSRSTYKHDTSSPPLSTYASHRPSQLEKYLQSRNDLCYQPVIINPRSVILSQILPTCSAPGR